MSFSDAMLYVNSLHKGKLEHEKSLLALIYRLVVWTRCDAKSFPDFEDVINELEGKATIQKVDDMALSLKSFAKKSKGGVDIGRNKR